MHSATQLYGRRARKYRNHRDRPLAGRVDPCCIQNMLSYVVILCQVYHVLYDWSIGLTYPIWIVSGFPPIQKLTTRMNCRKKFVVMAKDGQGPFLKHVYPQPRFPIIAPLLIWSTRGPEHQFFCEGIIPTRLVEVPISLPICSGGLGVLVWLEQSLSLFT